MKILDKLIIIIVVCTVGYVGITFTNCNFMVPGSIESANAKGELISAVRVETEDTIFLIKVSSQLKQMFDDLDIEEMDFSNEEKDEVDGEEESDDQYSKDKPVDDYED